MLSATLPQGVPAKPALPTTAFRLNGSGVAEEGIKLTTNHGLSFQKPVLFVGNRYFPCHEHISTVLVGDDLILYRGTVELVNRANAKPISKVVPPRGDDTPYLLLIDPNIKLAANATLRFVFWSGIEYTGEYVWTDRFTGETLVKLADGQGATIYYKDGRVLQAKRMGEQLVCDALSLEEQAELRLEHARAQIERSVVMQQSDFWYNQIITMLEVGSNRSHEAQELLYGVLDEAAKKRLMGGQTYHRFREVADASCRGIRFAKSLRGHIELKGVPADRRQRVAARAQSDRDACKGGGGGQQKKAKSDK